MTKLRAFATTSGILLAAASQAIIPFLNEPDTQHLWVGQIRGASGVVIAPHWVLSAKHVAFDGGTFAVGGTQYFPDFWINADGLAGRPATDLTLLHFPTTFTGYYKPYYGAVVGMHSTMAGWGISGVLRGDGTGYNSVGSSGGIRRAGQNKLSLLQIVGLLGDSVWALLFDLDGNGHDTFGDGGAIGGVPEASLGIGDSGGGMFVGIAGEKRLVGILAFIFEGFTPAGSPDPSYDFGDGGGGTALSPYGAWIQSVIGGPVVLPNNYQVTMGTQTSGTLASLFNPDDNRITIMADEITPSPEIVLFGTSPTSSASQIYFKIEAQASRSDMSEIVQLYNFQTLQYDPNASFVRAATLTDSGMTWLAAINPSQLIEPITRQIRAKVTWVPSVETNTIDGWSSGIDQGIWQVAP